MEISVGKYRYCTICVAKPKPLNDLPLFCTVRDKKYLHNVRISIEFNVFSSLQENLLCFCWLTYSYAFGVI